MKMPIEISIIMVAIASIVNSISIIIIAISEKKGGK